MRGRDRSRSRSRDRPQPVGRPPDDEHKVFIGNLSHECTESDLEGAFRRFGPLEYVRVVMDPTTQRSKGFGFVSFANIRDMEEAVAHMQGADLRGRPIRLDRATSRAQARNAPPPPVSGAPVPPAYDYTSNYRPRSPPRYDYPRDVPTRGYDAREPPRNYPRDIPRDYPRDGPRDYPRDGPRDYPRDIPRDYPRDGPRDYPRDIPRDIPRDYPRDAPRDYPRDMPRDRDRGYEPRDREMGRRGPDRYGPSDPPRDYYRPETGYNNSNYSNRDAPQPPAVAPAASQPPKGVCYAYQRGECRYGSACKFSHDTSSTSAPRAVSGAPKGACYAFQRGECRYGDGCKFSHEGTPQAGSTNNGHNGSIYDPFATSGASEAEVNQGW